jgi:hypothetical protein
MGRGNRQGSPSHHGRKGHVWDVAFSRDGAQVVCASRNVLVWDLKGNKELRHFGKDKSRYWGLSRDGRDVIADQSSEETDRSVQLLDVATRKEVARYHYGEESLAPEVLDY